MHHPLQQPILRKAERFPGGEMRVELAVVIDGHAFAGLAAFARAVTLPRMLRVRVLVFLERLLSFERARLLVRYQLIDHVSVVPPFLRRCVSLRGFLDQLQELQEEHLFWLHVCLGEELDVRALAMPLRKLEECRVRDKVGSLSRSAYQEGGGVGSEGVAHCLNAPGTALHADAHHRNLVAFVEKSVRLRGVLPRVHSLPAVARRLEDAVDAPKLVTLIVRNRSLEIGAQPCFLPEKQVILPVVREDEVRVMLVQARRVPVLFVVTRLGVVAPDGEALDARPRTVLVHLDERGAARGLRGFGAPRCGVAVRREGRRPLQHREGRDANEGHVRRELVPCLANVFHDALIRATRHEPRVNRL
mmetsp:Transcript_6240/g.15140  ORF Transcript_6240/g.15140 Transcript_6240/m.15140 type:complete len:360 (-) Transcript_6240:803-1882(-)